MLERIAIMFDAPHIDFIYCHLCGPLPVVIEWARLQDFVGVA